MPYLLIFVRMTSWHSLTGTWMKSSFLVLSLEVKKFSVQILSTDLAVHKYKSIGVMWISYFLTSALNSFCSTVRKSCSHCLTSVSVCTLLSVIVVQS